MLTWCGEEIAVDWAWVRDELIRTELRNKTGERDRIIAAIDACIGRARTLITPAFAAEELAITAGTDRAITAGTLSITAPKIVSCLAGAKRLSLFVITLGTTLEETASALMRDGETLEGYLIDRIGSAAVESLAAAMERALAARAKKDDESISARLSPGYCDWPVDEQRTLNRALDLSRAGVRLTESCMMLPRKSISAVIGIGPRERYTKKSRSQCGICSHIDCSYRRNV